MQWRELRGKGLQSERTAMAIRGPCQRLLERSATTEKHKSDEVIARRRSQSQEGVFFVCGTEFTRKRSVESCPWSCVCVERVTRRKSDRVATVLPSASTTVTERENTAKDDQGNDEV